eukprot:RCo029455
MSAPTPADSAAAEVLRQYGLNEKGVRDTLVNKELTALLLDLHAKFGAGKLLYTVATKCDSEPHRLLLGKYISEGKVTTSQQLDGALRFLKECGGRAVGFGDAELEKASGVGVTVSDAELASAVQVALAEEKAAIEEERYQYNFSDLLGKLKKAERVKWADAARIRAEIDRQAAALLGPKTAEDLAGGKPKKKDKAPAAAKEPKAAPKAPKAVPTDSAAQAEAEQRQRLSQAVSAVRGSFLFSLPRKEIQSLQQDAREGAIPDEGQVVEVGGWIRTIRQQAAVNFVELNDGSTPESLQVVVVEANFSDKESCRGFLAKASTGTCVKFWGRVVKSIAKGQLIEMQATKVEVCGTVSEGFPISKTALSLDTLRQHQHLRIRTNVVASVMRIRDTCAFAVNQFFHQRGFKYVHTPILTSNDCEGAGETFTVTTLLKEGEHGGPPVVRPGVRSFAEDFFARKAMLTVSGQLNVETYCAGLSKVYTFGPTFRAEESNTTRHLAEFWMIEPELWFAGLPEIMSLAEDFIKSVIALVMEECATDLLYLDAYHRRVAEGKSDEEKEAQQQAKSRLAEGGLIDRLLHVIKEPFARTTYTNAIELLAKVHASGEATFTEAPVWGMDMGAEHERYLCEKMFKKPVIVTNYPRKIKAFYMKQDEGGQTVQAMDILVPYIGEIIGGSAREDNLEKLLANMADKGIPAEGLQWYLDLRRFGSAPHAGFGLGFERMVLLVTGMLNIRDVIPFPRAVGLANH